MINKLLALASKYVPVGLGIKGIGKIDPRLEKFFTAAALAGYGADEAMGFVRDRLEGKTVANADEQDRLDQGSSQGTLRPDEGAARQRVKESNRVPNAIQKAAAISTGALAGGGTLSASQDLESAVSPELKGLSEKVGQTAENVREAPHQAKINPMNAANAASQGVKSAVEAPGRLQTALSKKNLEGATGAANLIAQFPELGKYLDELIQAGNPPEEAAAQAKTIKKFLPQIQAIEQKVGEEFENIIAQLFGKGQNAQGTQQTAQKSNGGISQALSMLRDLQAKIKAPRG